MNFESKSDFKEKNVTISVKDLKDVYDTDGNMMHENKATFYIKGYINYPETTQKMVKVTGQLCKFKIFYYYFNNDHSRGFFCPCSSNRICCKFNDIYV